MGENNPRIYKELLELHHHHHLKWAKDLNRPFTKEDTPVVDEPMKRCSTSLVIREMKLKPQSDATTHDNG